MRPSSVSLPVATTTPVARPDTTIVPENAMLSRSPTVALAGTGSVFFSAGTDSPVSAASSVRRFFASMSRRSAGILSPELEQHDVARNELFGRKHARLAAAHGPRLGGKHVADRIQRLLRPALLDEAEQRVEDDHGEDDRRVEPQAQHQLGEPGAEQDIDKDVVELGEEAHERAPLLAFRQPVRPILLEPGRGLGSVEAIFPVGGEPLHGLICRHRVPGRDFTRRAGVRRCAHNYPPSSRFLPLIGQSQMGYSAGCRNANSC